MIRQRADTQQGQALVLGMLLIGAATIAFLQYFAVGEMVSAKARQLHALDAAAYSGALIQARALNMLAYLNTAQIGHQMAMAHLVTLGSWSALGGTQARQAGVGNPPAHVIAMMFGADHGSAYAASRRASAMSSLARTDGELARAYAAHDHFVMQVFGHVQQAIVAGVPAARFNTIQAVLAHNYPAYLAEHTGSHSGRVLPASTSSAALPISARPDNNRFDISITHDNWAGYTQAYSGRAKLHSFVQHVAALYRFLEPRDFTAANNWMVDARCPSLRHELRRRGRTRLGPDGRWQSSDTQSFHALRANRWVGCYRREYPMGWGWIPSAVGQTPDSPYVDDPPDNFSAQDFWRWVKQATSWDLLAGDSNPLANSKAVASRQRWQGSGLPAYIDVNRRNDGQALRFDVALRHPGPDGSVITTRSAAETFFARPQPRHDNLFERANLFHPYWQARLSTSVDQSGGVSP